LLLRLRRTIDHVDIARYGKRGKGAGGRMIQGAPQPTLAAPSSYRLPTYSGDFHCACYYRLLIVNQFRDLYRRDLPSKNVHFADDRRVVLEPGVARDWYRRNVAQMTRFLV
jgi:hypothetical protein